MKFTKEELDYLHTDVKINLTHVRGLQLKKFRKNSWTPQDKERVIKKEVFLLAILEKLEHLTKKLEEK
tara:strand:- start:38 stop:241 length:204 start_codon:yes stop_codon:yes gene_type:complete